MTIRFFKICIFLFCSVLCAADRPPNIVLIIGDDMGPELGCYGHPDAITPNMDRLAKEGVRFTHCYSHNGMCAPSRSGLITGRYPTSIGTHHMRSTLLNPPPMFTDYLKQVGYTIAWPLKREDFGKRDFNFAVPKGAFDQQNDWTKALPKEPFFATYHIPHTHQYQIYQKRYDAFIQNELEALPESLRRYPSSIHIPAFYPDDEVIRKNLATYHELVTVADQHVGFVLDTLEKARCAEKTVVILIGDQGMGLPRFKRTLYDSGLHIPLIVRWPEHIPAGTVRDDLACLLDLAPTCLAFAGTSIPEDFDGRVLFGEKMQPEPSYVFAARDRNDEITDRIRSVRDRRFHYLRNYHPEISRADGSDSEETIPTMQAWRRMQQEQKLTEATALFVAPTKPEEELYDTQSDPDEIHNLVMDPTYAETIKAMREALDEWIKRTGDLGAVPERELIRRGMVKDVLDGYYLQPDRDELPFPF